LFFFYKNPSSPSATAQALGEATSKILFFCFLLFHVNNKAYIYIYIYITNHKSTSICHKPHLYITNDQICPKSTIYYKPHVQKYTLFQVHKFNTKKRLRRRLTATVRGGTPQRAIPATVQVGMARRAMPATLRHGSTPPPIDAAKKRGDCT